MFPTLLDMVCIRRGPATIRRIANLVDAWSSSSRGNTEPYVMQQCQCLNGTNGLRCTDMCKVQACHKDLGV